MRVQYAAIDSPFGEVWFGAGDEGLVALDVDTTGGAFAHQLVLAGYLPQYAPGELNLIAAQLDEYFDGIRRSFAIPLDLSHQTPFRRAVMDAVAAIPYGEMRSYKQVAESVGKPLAARAVGSTMATCPISIVVPCHRVVRAALLTTPNDLGGNRGETRRLALIRWERRFREG